MSALTSLIVDLLRKKEEEKALMQGGPTAGVGSTPTPGMLGDGAAARAAELLLKRKSRPMDVADSIS